MTEDVVERTHIDLNDPRTRRKALIIAAAGGAGIGLFLLTRKDKAEGVIPVVQEEGHITTGDSSALEDYLQSLTGAMDKLSANLYGYVDEQIAASQQAMQDLAQQMADALGGVYQYIGEQLSYAEAGYPASVEYAYDSSPVPHKPKSPAGGTIEKIIDTMRDILRYAAAFAKAVPDAKPEPAPPKPAIEYGRSATARRYREQAQAQKREKATGRLARTAESDFRLQRKLFADDGVVTQRLPAPAGMRTHVFQTSVPVAPRAPRAKIAQRAKQAVQTVFSAVQSVVHVAPQPVQPMTRTTTTTRRAVIPVRMHEQVPTAPGRTTRLGGR